MRDRFYLACFRDNLGGSVAWHAKGGRGYTTDIDKAHVYTREEAQNAWERGREFDRPISADHVDELAAYRVDCQYIPSEPTKGAPFCGYAVFKKATWSGNDVHWLSNEGYSVDFSDAKRIFLAHAKMIPDAVSMPYELADKNKRRTFQAQNYNKRIMTQGAGIKIPEHVKRWNRRSSRNLTRFNCPSCGKINWQHNPYDFDGCNDVFCDQYPRNHRFGNAYN